jgi:hypothetical protein
MERLDVGGHQVSEEGRSGSLVALAETPAKVIGGPRRRMVAAVFGRVLGDRIRLVRRSQSLHSMQSHNLDSLR